MSTKLKYVCYALLVTYFASMFYIINKGIGDIQASSYRIGCMSVPNTPIEAIELCKAKAK